MIACVRVDLFINLNQSTKVSTWSYIYTYQLFVLEVIERPATPLIGYCLLLSLFTPLILHLFISPGLYFVTDRLLLSFSFIFSNLYHCLPVSSYAHVYNLKIMIPKYLFAPVLQTLSTATYIRLTCYYLRLIDWLAPVCRCTSTCPAAWWSVPPCLNSSHSSSLPTCHYSTTHHQPSTMSSTPQMSVYSILTIPPKKKKYTSTTTTSTMFSVCPDLHNAPGCHSVLRLSIAV